MRRLFPLLILVLSLTACEPPKVVLSQEKPTFTGQPFAFSASDLNVTPDATPNPQDIQHQAGLATDLAQGVQLWANDRLRLTGGPNRIEILINDASITEQKLPLTKGAEGYFTNDQVARYTGALSVTLRLYTPQSNLAVAETQAQTTAVTSVAEADSQSERTAKLVRLQNTLLQQLDAQFISLIPQYFGAYLGAQ